MPCDLRLSLQRSPNLVEGRTELGKVQPEDIKAWFLSARRNLNRPRSIIVLTPAHLISIFGAAKCGAFGVP